MCSNAVASANVNTAFASENANTAFALAFDCPVMDAFALATNANQMPPYYCCSTMFIFLVGFIWNMPQEDQYKTL